MSGRYAHRASRLKFAATFLLASFAVVGTAAAQMKINKILIPHQDVELDPAKINLRLQKQRLGRALFFDKTLSNPRGMACASCHSPSSGFTYPESDENLEFGTVEGIIKSRVGNRKPPSIAYAQYLPPGPPTYDPDLTAFAGGLFWDGRADNLVEQIGFPLENPNEMNNFDHGVPAPEILAAKIRKGPHRAQFKSIFGDNALEQLPAAIEKMVAESIAEFEKSEEVSPFTSKYDAYVHGKAKLSASELRGLQLMTGTLSGRPDVGDPAPKNALCMLCHGIQSDPKAGPDIFTNSCFANIGVPKNTANRYYQNTDQVDNPGGFNAAGADYIDLGLGDHVYPTLGLPPGNMGTGSDGQGDYLAINGTFKAPTLRNVAKRPGAGFHRAYMHNGVFKSLKQVVHFYNTRALTTVAGEQIDFTQADPYGSLKGTPLWPTPEFPSPDTLQNATGDPGSPDAQVGNLGLTDSEEDDIVAFLQTLSDGWWKK